MLDIRNRLDNEEILDNVCNLSWVTDPSNLLTVCNNINNIFSNNIEEVIPSNDSLNGSLNQLNTIPIQYNTICSNTSSCCNSELSEGETIIPEQYSYICNA